MATSLKLKQCDDDEQSRREGREVLIGQQVIRALGEPSELLQVQVRELWERRYRLNVFVGPDAVAARVAHSFFLETDDNGNITESTPRITRQYGRVTEGANALSAPEAVTTG